MVKPMKIRALFVVFFLAVGTVVARDQPVGDTPEARSPHAMALDLVLKSHAAEIRKVDKGDVWHDTLERTWKVQRPFSPGVINSTTWFEVRYFIDGKEAASWQVDLRERRSHRRPAEDEKPVKPVSP